MTTTTGAQGFQTTPQSYSLLIRGGHGAILDVLSENLLVQSSFWLTAFLCGKGTNRSVHCIECSSKLGFTWFTQVCSQWRGWSLYVPGCPAAQVYLVALPFSDVVIEVTSSKINTGHRTYPLICTHVPHQAIHAKLDSVAWWDANDPDFVCPPVRPDLSWFLILNPALLLFKASFIWDLLLLRMAHTTSLKIAMKLLGMAPEENPVMTVDTLKTTLQTV